MILNQNYLSDEIGGEYITYSHFYNDGMSTIYLLIAWNTFSIERKSKLKLSKWNEKMYSNRFHEFLKYAKWSYRALDLLCNLMVIFWIPFFQDFKIIFRWFFEFRLHLIHSYIHEFRVFQQKKYIGFLLISHQNSPHISLNDDKPLKKFSSIVFSFLWFPSNLNTAFYFCHQNATNAFSIIPVVSSISIDFQSEYCAKCSETKQNHKRSKTIEKNKWHGQLCKRHQVPIQLKSFTCLVGG